MGEILYLENYKSCAHAAVDAKTKKVPQTERQRIESIRDNI
jgi:hypothetical protein